MTPRDVVGAWLDAFARDDMVAARALFPDEAVLHSAEPAGDSRGFDEALACLAEKRRRAGAGFRYDVRQILATSQYAAVHFELRTTEREWGQLAVYRVHAGRIVEVWLYEDEA